MGGILSKPKVPDPPPPPPPPDTTEARRTEVAQRGRQRGRSQNILAGGQTLGDTAGGNVLLG